MSTTDSGALTSCYHCGEVVPPGVDITVELGGEARPMCCPGCGAVARLIAGAGMESFYRQRTAFATRPESAAPGTAAQYAIYDDPDFQREFTRPGPTGELDTRVLLGGITCAACTWLIEQSLRRVAGVSRATVSLQQSRLDLRFDPQQVKLSDLFAAVERLGYRARPFNASSQRQQMAREQRRDLGRLAVAGVGMMQVGMFAVALHAGDIQGITAEYQQLLRWVSLIVSSFVVLFSARPFFESAWRHLRAGALVMDLPVALAIGLAWTASAWATVSGSGQVYFDSVVMFTFFLLLGRFLEKRVRYRQALGWFDAESALPDAVSRWHPNGWQTVPRLRLEKGDRILVKQGETIPVDAVLLDGHSAVREEAFNGEHLPREVGPGHTVYAGTVNVEAPIETEVLGSYLETRLAALQRSTEQAQGDKPALAQLADRISGWFIGGVLLATSITALLWWQAAPERALWISLSVLVISCPCALALATPAALANAAGALRSSGVIVRGENALEALAHCRRLIFDKTGTLTRGELEVSRVISLAGTARDTLLAEAAALQHYSAHPVARAFDAYAPAEGFSDVHYEVGAGLEARRVGQTYRLGSAAFCAGIAPGLGPAPDDQWYWIAYCRENEPLAWFGLHDALRPEAPAVIDAVHRAGLSTELLSGDPSPHGPRLAAELGIGEVRSGQTPQQKMARVRQLQLQEQVVGMVGDGLNDAPVLALADASFAVAGATGLARAQADFIVLDGDLSQVAKTLNMARRCHRVIVQNLCWALGYNLLAIPAAAMGYVPPWAAAIGMSLSSLLVVGNSLRLNKPPTC